MYLPMYGTLTLTDLGFIHPQLIIVGLLWIIGGSCLLHCAWSHINYQLQTCSCDGKMTSVELVYIYILILDQSWYKRIHIFIHGQLVWI